MKFIYLLGVVIWANLGLAQQGFKEIMADSNQKDWSLILSPYALLASQATDVGGERLRQSFNDLSSITNAGFQLDAALRYKRVLLSIDGTYANLKTNQDIGPINTKLDLTQWIVDTKLGYLIHSELDFSKTDEVIRGWSISANIGVKYWRNDVRLNVDASQLIGIPYVENIQQLQEWTDFMVGARAHIILNKRVLLGIQADMGGFGIGNSSDLSWDFTYVNTFEVYKRLYVTAGLRSFSYKRTDVNDGNELKTKVSVIGPLIGISLLL